MPSSPAGAAGAAACLPQPSPAALTRSAGCLPSRTHPPPWLPACTPQSPPPGWLQQATVDGRVGPQGTQAFKRRGSVDRPPVRAARWSGACCGAAGRERAHEPQCGAPLTILEAALYLVTTSGCRGRPSGEAWSARGGGATVRAPPAYCRPRAGFRAQNQHCAGTWRCQPAPGQQGRAQGSPVCMPPGPPAPPAAEHTITPPLAAPGRHRPSIDCHGPAPSPAPPITPPPAALHCSGSPLGARGRRRIRSFSRRWQLSWQPPQHSKGPCMSQSASMVRPAFVAPGSRPGGVAPGAQQCLQQRLLAQLVSCRPQPPPERPPHRSPG